MDKREVIISFLMDQIVNDGGDRTDVSLSILMDLYQDKIIDMCTDLVRRYGSHEVPNQIKDMIARDMAELK